MANKAFNLCGLFKISIFMSLDQNRNVSFIFALSQAAVKIEKWLPFAQNWTYSHETWFSICRSACFYEWMQSIWNLKQTLSLFRCRPTKRRAIFVVGLQVVLKKSGFPYAQLFFPKSGVNWFLFLYQTTPLGCFHWINNVKWLCFQDYFLCVGVNYTHPEAGHLGVLTVVTHISWLSIKTVTPV